MRRLKLLVLAPACLLSGCLASIANYMYPRVEMAETQPVAPVVAAPQAAPTGSIFQSSTYRPLFEDHRARLVGDTLTVQIAEKVAASQKSTSSIDKTGDSSAGVTAIPGISPGSFGRANFGANSANTFAGKGSTENTNDFTGTITVVVREVLPNGHLLVAGEKQIGVNANVDVPALLGPARPPRHPARQRRTEHADRQRAARAPRPRCPGRRAGGRLADARVPQRAADLMAMTMRDLSERALRWLVTLAFVAASAAVWWPTSAAAARLKEVATVQGVRSNALTGMGLVIGLDGTGDQVTQTPYTTQGLTAMLQQMGITVPAGASLSPRNVAAVMVTAQLPPFAQPGQAIDVTVASLGNAKSLRGGTLITTPLKGADGQIYALAQGNLIVGGAGAAAGGSKVQINHLSAGRIPEGATVERAVPTPLNQGDAIRLDLNASDYSLARAVAKAINEAKGEGTASALDGRVVRVKVPADSNDRVGFLADIENLSIEQAQRGARIVLNARTGSVVLNDAVTLGPCAVAHGSLSVTISSTPAVSQPAPLSQGTTVAGEKTDISITQQGGPIVQLPAGAKLSEVVKALNALGATPQDLLAILQAIRSAGALNAEIEVI